MHGIFFWKLVTSFRYTSCHDLVLSRFCANDFKVNAAALNIFKQFSLRLNKSKYLSANEALKIHCYLLPFYYKFYDKKISIVYLRIFRKLFFISFNLVILGIAIHLRHMTSRALKFTASLVFTIAYFVLLSMKRSPSFLRRMARLMPLNSKFSKEGNAFPAVISIETGMLRNLSIFRLQILKLFRKDMYASSIEYLFTSWTPALNSRDGLLRLLEGGCQEITEDEVGRSQASVFVQYQPFPIRYRSVLPICIFQVNGICLSNNVFNSDRKRLEVLQEQAEEQKTSDLCPYRHGMIFYDDLKVCWHDLIFSDSIHFWWMFYNLFTFNLYQQQIN